MFTSIAVIVLFLCASTSSSILSAVHNKDLIDVVNCVSAIAKSSFRRNKLLVVLVGDSCVSDIPYNKKGTNTILYQRGLINEITRSISKEDLTMTSNYVLATQYSSNIWPVIVIHTASLKSEFKLLDLFDKSYSYIVILNNDENNQLEQLNAHLRASQNSSVWNVLAKWIIVTITSPFKNKYEEGNWSLTLMKSAQDFKILNVVIVVATVASAQDTRYHRADEYVEVTSWDIYTRFLGNVFAKCNRTLVQVNITNTWVKKGGGYLRHSRKIFPNIDLKNLNGCPIFVAAVAYPPFVMSPSENQTASIEVSEEEMVRMASNHTLFTDGLEVRLLRNIGKIMNFTIVYRSSTWSDRLDEVTNSTADVCLTANILTQEQILLLDLTKPYLKEVGLWFVPAREEIPKWQSLKIIFSPGVWLCAALSYFVGVASIWLFANRKFDLNTTNSCHLVREHDSFRDIGTVALNVVSTTFGESVTKKPLTPSLRVFYVMWIFYCLEIDTAYQSSLVGVLTHTFYEPKLTSLEDIFDFDLKIVLSDAVVKIFNASDEPRYLEAVRRHKPCKANCEEEFDVDKKIAFVFGKYGMEYLTYTKYMRDGRPLLYELNEVIINVDISMALHKGSILLPKFDAIITIILESGLIKKWWDDLRSSSIKYIDAQKVDEEDGEDPNVLKMSHLQGVFDLLLLCWIISIFVFLIEIVTILRMSSNPKGFSKSSIRLRHPAKSIKIRSMSQFTNHIYYRTEEIVDKDKVKTWHL